MSTALFTLLPTAFVLIIGLCVATFFVRLHRQTQYLRQHGTPAEATILQMDRTLMQINRRYVYDFLLEMNVPGRPAYRLRHQSRAHDWNVFLLEPGVRLKVRVDPDDPQRFVVLGPVTPQRPQSLQDLLSGVGRSAASPTPPADPVKALKDLQSMLDHGLITQDEYAQKKTEILSRL